MSDLIPDLLDVGRLESVALSVTPEPVATARLIDEARNTFLSGGGSDDIQLGLDPDLPSVTADRRRIVQVLSNLLANAAKHTPDTTPIVVRGVHDGVHVAISVEDKGNGITAESLPLLFRTFSRGDAGEEGAQEIGGTGLGLAICGGIVDAHSGRTWA